MATIVIGLVAAVLTYAVLRGGSSVEVAFANGELRPNDVITETTFRFESMRLPTSAQKQVLTRAGLAGVEGGRVLVRMAKGALITTNMVTGDSLPTIRRVPLPVEAVPPDLRKGDLIEVGMPSGAQPEGAKKGDLLFGVAEVACADVTKPFNQILYVEVPSSESKMAVNLPTTGKVKFALITERDGARPAGPPVGPC